jgi:carotenoid cleavage dioxygenase
MIAKIEQAGVGAEAAAGAGAPQGAPDSKSFVFESGPPRTELDCYDVQVEGRLPADLDGVFYRLGPDPQYPKRTVPLDGEGHVSMFRIRKGHVDYKSRFVRTQRFKAQHEARRALFGMYRNPLTDDPSVKNLSGGTANTQVFFHHGKLLALKEDSPPVTLDPLTLETTNDYYTFGGGMTGRTFTAHPKIDPVTGELVAFGYEARGLATDDVEVLSVDRAGRVNWSAWIKVPYAGMIHDFGVTQKHIVFLVIPMVTSMDLIKAGGPHFAWDSKLPTYLGIMRRNGDGKDIRWFKGPTWMATHTMGAWSEGEKVYIDMDGARGNQFPFFPAIHEPNASMPPLPGHVTRLTVDLKSKNESYDMEVLYPEVLGVLARQDDRYHTVPYRYGFLSVFGPGGRGWAMFDHERRAVKVLSLGPDANMQEMCFVPRRNGAPEGDGYLIGVVNRSKEQGRSDLVLVDAQRLDEGPIATVKMPYQVASQVHGFWVSGEQLPKASPA